MTKLRIMIAAGLLWAGAAHAAAWQTVYQENFDKAGWETNWTLKGSVGPTDQKALRGGGHELRAKLNQTFTASVIRVEYDATMMKAGENNSWGDLSAFIGKVFFQFGGEDNTRTSIRCDQAAAVVAEPHLPLIATGKTYRVTAEVNGRHCRLSINGQLAAQCLLDKPLTEATVTLYTWSGKSRFGNLRVQTSALADPTPDEFIQRVTQQKQKDEEAKKKAHDDWQAQGPKAPNSKLGELRATPTIHSVGIEWDIEGDNNHNAVCTVRYRQPGAAEWKTALPLLRIDFRGWYNNKESKAYRYFNMFAGSIMFLEPDTPYEVELSATDPDGGAEKKTMTLATRPVPKLAKATRTLHVIPEPGKSAPGPGQGDGSKKKPFKGLPAADAAARPGDVFLLHAGEYEGHTLTKAGTPGKYIAWKAAGDGEALLRSALGIAANHLWIEGLVFEPTQEKDFSGIRGKGHPWHNLVAVRNTFRNCRYAFSNTDKEWKGKPEELDRYWYLADNVMDGDMWTEYGCRLYLLADSDICYNRISKKPVNDKGGDAISLRFCMNIDVYGNDIHDIDDDLFEPDYSYGNIRIWKNRGINPRFQAVSFQPMLCSPWYIVRNEFVLTHPDRKATLFKCCVPDRTVQVNNTYYIRGRYGQIGAEIMFKAFSRNNLWVHTYDNPNQKTEPGGAVWQGDGDGNRHNPRYTRDGQTMPDWRTDIDYDGFAWDHVPDMDMPFGWWDRRTQLSQWKDLAGFAAAKGVEKHAVQLENDKIFEIPDVLAYGKERWSSKRLTLQKDSKAIDAGAPVPNLCEEFEGKAPDLGAYEYGSPLTRYGPRPLSGK